MFINRIKLTNWKNFLNVNVHLSERTFIVGPNACGKSNLLDAIRALRDVAREGGGLQEAVRLRGGLSKIRCLSARAPYTTDVIIEIEVTETSGGEPKWLYELALSQKGGGARGENKALVRKERVIHLGKEIITRPQDEDRTDDELLFYTHLEQPTANVKFRELAEFLRDIDYQHIIPQAIRSPYQFQKNGVEEEFYGRDLFEKMTNMNSRTRESQLKKIEKALKCAVPNLKNLSLEKDGMGVPHIQAIYEHWRPRGAKQNEEQFSDGTLRLIGLLFAMQNGRQPLLLEEPELSLNAGVIRHLAETIYLLQKRKSGKRQIILSTHSYDLLNNKGIAAEEIVLLKPQAEGTDAQNCNRVEEIRELLANGIAPAEAVLPFTENQNVSQLPHSFSNSEK